MFIKVRIPQWVGWRFESPPQGKRFCNEIYARCGSWQQGVLFRF
jgi:hypothetical protein